MKMESKVRTCWWFDGQGEDAATFYVSLLPDSHIETVWRPPDPDASTLVVEFTLAGAPMMALNGGPMFKQTEAASISVLTEDQAETDRLWEKLVADGGEESMCGWLKDKYGVSWQICPRRLVELTNHEDTAGAGRVREAMLQMRKIDIAALEAAFNGV